MRLPAARDLLRAVRYAVRRHPQAALGARRAVSLVLLVGLVAVTYLVTPGGWHGEISFIVGTFVVVAVIKAVATGYNDKLLGAGQVPSQDPTVPALPAHGGRAPVCVSLLDRGSRHRLVRVDRLDGGASASRSVSSTRELADFVHSVRPDIDLRDRTQIFWNGGLPWEWRRV